jgi:hypothetical protein
MDFPSEQNIKWVYLMTGSLLLFLLTLAIGWFGNIAFMLYPSMLTGGIFAIFASIWAFKYDNKG